MDLTHDGIPDIISGSYPGEIYLFAGTKDGGYAKAVKLQSRDGKDLKVDRASAVCVADWDRDGDLDLVVGNIKGEVWFIPNEGGSGPPVFGEPVRLSAAGRPIEAPGRNAGPHVADWDGDGVADLVLGCGDGGVLYYRNTATDGGPVLAAPIELVPKSARYGGAQPAGAKEPSGSEHGYRAKVWVADWDGDGRLDLLVGDCASKSEPAPQLTGEQIAERDRLLERQAALRQTYVELSKHLQQKLEAECGHTLRDAPADRRDEVMQVWRRLTQEDPGYQSYIKSSRDLYQKLQPFQAKRTTHGHVWVYLRAGPRAL